MPTRLDRLMRKMHLSGESLLLLERLSRMGGVVMMVATGLFFLVWPPTSTAALWGGDIPPYVWGFFMVLGGVLSVWGLVSRVLQTEQTGMFILALAIAFYALNQTMIMFQIPITWSRAGSTGILIAFFLTACARYFGLTAQILAARRTRMLEGQ